MLGDLVCNKDYKIMEEKYTPATVEAEAQGFWESQESFKAAEDLHREKFFCLAMLPYPSGHLHMGHVRNYTLGDVIARYQLLQGKNVLHPMGWDAFGLPAENAALKHGVAPAKWTYENIAHMRRQLQRLGFSYDWSREITTCDPDYYRWEQWLFIQLYERGLVYRKNAVVNWDPVDKTVLANEQVINGRGWRSDALVERREMPQWFFKITQYADELLTDLDRLTDWPEKVKTMQRHWIGRSEGLTIRFPVNGQDTILEIFTTRPDTFLGVTYVAIAAQHPLALQAAQQDTNIAAFIAACRHVPVAEEAMATLEKRGIATPFHVTHPLTGATLPVWIANFVLMEYGSGAVMAVPAHDQRDYEFAKQYRLPIKQVVVPHDNNSTWDLSENAYTGEGPLINSGVFNGLNFADACTAITKALIAKGCAEQRVNYRLRDWGISRQRYWGAPIPIIYCDDCGTVPANLADLPIILPENIHFTGSGDLLRSLPEFYHTTCPRCGKAATRETDTFDTFVESSWYYARYACANQQKKMLDDRANYWTPVDQYIGGVEHAVMHLLYARFFHKVLRDLEFFNCDEPFTRLLTQGMVLNNGSKMSKSVGNTVDPQALIEKYGADTVRLFIIFAAPPEQSLEWSDSGVEGAYRFLKRLWNFAYKEQMDLVATNHACLHHSIEKINWAEAPASANDYRRQIHSILRQAKYDYERLQFNTVVSACMKLLNLLIKIAEDSADFTHTVRSHLIHSGMQILLCLLNPITPHIVHNLWRVLAYGDNILSAKFPKLATDVLKCETVELVVQINGKRRGQITVPHEASGTAQQIEALLIHDEKIQQWLNHQPIKRCIVVPGKLVNLVVDA